MKIKELLKEIKGVFKPPKKKYYFGRLAFGIPYFYPCNFHSTILSVRKLKPRTEEEYQEYITRYPHLRDKNEAKFQLKLEL